jgi:hypothetical protein
MGDFGGVYRFDDCAVLVCNARIHTRKDRVKYSGAQEVARTRYNKSRTALIYSNDKIASRETGTLCSRQK